LVLPRRRGAHDRRKEVTVIDLTDKVMAYANALDSDIAAEQWQQVRDGKLWRGYVGTIYGCPVGTDSGTTFDTAAAALANAALMRQQCREIVRVRNAVEAEQLLDGFGPRKVRGD